jgi:4-amino-4-deoxy-L-arabinose transferase-like glycosyltransferase
VDARAADRLAAVALAATVGVFLAVSWLYATRIPKWNAPDEPAHYNYIRQIAETGTLPVLLPGSYDVREVEARMSARFPDSMPVDWMHYESHQPPLYYLIATPVYLASTGVDLDARVLALRAFTSLIGAGAVLLAFLAVRTVFPAERGLALATSGVIAFVPMFVAMSAAVGNDALATAVLTGALLMLFRCLRGARTRGFDAAVGVVVGLALLTKVSAYIAVLLAIAAYALAEIDRAGARRSWGAAIGSAARRLGVVLGVAAIVSGWWFMRNVATYGLLDPFGLRRHDLVVAGQPLTGGITFEALRHFALTLFRSFWAQFGWMGIVAEDRVYWALALLTGTSALGLVVLAVRAIRGLVRVPTVQRDAIVLLVGTWILAMLATVLYNLTYLQPQGRYLFPALLPMALGLSAGLGALTPRILRPAALAGLVCCLTLLALLCLYRYVVPYFAD